jgi:autotransporter translocation and assembly factor TamB
VASMAVIVTQTTWFKEWLRAFIVRQADDYVNGRLSIGRLDGNLFFGIELEDVDVAMNGKTVVDIEDVGIDYNVLSFIGGDIVLDDIRLNRPTLRLERTADGWNLTQLVKAQTPDPDEPKNRRTIEIGEIGVSDGTLYFADQPVGTTGVQVPSRIEALDASVGVKSDAEALMVDIGHVSMRAVDPAFDLNALSGTIRRTENEIALENVSIRTAESSLRVEGTIGNIEGETPVVDLRTSSDKLALAEIARLVPALRGYAMQPAFEISASGPADRLAVDLNVRDATLGRATGDLTVDAMEPGRRVAGTVSFERLNVGAVLPADTPAPGAAGRADRATGLTSDMTGEARFDLALPDDRLPLSGTYQVNAGHVRIAGYEARNVVADGRIDGETIRVNARAAAYGGEATVAGTVRTGDPLALDLSGRATGVDLRNLPPSLNVPAVPSRLAVEYAVTGRGSVFTGNVKLDGSTVAGASIAPGTTARFRVGAGAPEYAASGQVSGLDLQQIGQGFDVTALQADRYQSRLNMSFDVSGSGGGEYPLTLEATGTMVDSEMFGASFPHMDFTAHLSGGDARVRTKGQFANLNPALVSGNDRVAGIVNGAVDVETTIRGYADGVTVDSIDLAGRASLTDSAIADLAITTALVDGKYAEREGDLTELTIEGPDINVTGEGHIALNDTGSTSLTVHVDTASLERVGKLVDQPLKGSADVDATVTGNARMLNVQGTLKGSDIGHGDNEALSLVSEFDVAIPELIPADAVVKASNMATFLEVGGQRITELDADLTYSQSKLEFDASAQEGEREVDAAGSVIFHPDHQEIHLPSLALRTEGVEWRTVAGSEARVQYGNDRVEVENLELVNADQRITASGVLGSMDQPLRVRIDNVDVAEVDRLLLGDQRVTGRFSADATITGPMKGPNVQAEFALTGGAFREFKFESFGGQVQYAQQGVSLDVRLQQTEAHWLTAKGRAPMTLFQPTPEELAGTHQPPAPGEEVDIEVASSQIDLGVIQGFTSYVTDVTGVMQANLRVTGSGYDPHINGAVEIRGGTFQVPELGTSYTGLETRVDLDDEGVSIQEFKVLDQRGFPLTIGGTLAFHARSVGAVNVTVNAEKFEVIDNPLADVKLNTRISVTGEVRKPRVEGTIEVENGTIDVARLLETVTADAYATEAASLGEEPAPPPEEAPEPSIFDALQLDVALSIPSNLVLRGDDIRAANAPISIGDANITVGGTLEVQKNANERIRLAGDVTTVRGTYTFQGRRFDIMRDGRIGFSGAETDELDPLLDVRARRIISGVETFVNVRGTMRNPELSFSSNPPLEEADILSLIVFNQPINQLGEGQQVSLAERAGALASGYLTSGLARSIGNALEIDEFEIQAQGEGGTGPSVTLGEQVGRNLFFRLRQAFGAEQTTELILEYQIAEFLRLQGAVAQGDLTQRVQFRRIERLGLDLVFFFSY